MFPIGPTSSATYTAPIAPAAPVQPMVEKGDDAEVRQAFQAFVGETFFAQMIKAMRKTQEKPAYFHGGRGEEVFQQQLDQVLSEKLATASADRFAGPMYELFALGRR